MSIEPLGFLGCGNVIITMVLGPPCPLVPSVHTIYRGCFSGNDGHCAYGSYQRERHSPKYDWRRCAPRRGAMWRHDRARRSGGKAPLSHICCFTGRAGVPQHSLAACTPWCIGAYSTSHTWPLGVAATIVVAAAIAAVKVPFLAPECSIGGPGWPPHHHAHWPWHSG